MKTAAALLATSLTVFALSSAAPAQTGGTTTTTPATTTAPKVVAPKLKTVLGEVVSVDATAKTITVKHTVKGKSEDMTFGAGEKASAALGTLKAGDHVRVAYADVDGKPMASTIAKVVKK